MIVRGAQRGGLITPLRYHALSGIRVGTNQANTFETGWVKVCHFINVVIKGVQPQEMRKPVALVTVVR